MLHQRSANFITAAEEKREDASGKAARFDCRYDDLTYDLARAGMGGMRFDKDWIAACKRGCGITTGNGKCQRKVACAKDGYRAERSQHRANIRFGWRASSISGVDAGHQPRAFLDNTRKQP